MEDLRTELIHLLDGEQNEQLALLQKLIQTPSPNPPGGTVAAIQAVQDHFNRYGIESEIVAPIATSPNLVSIVENHDRTPRVAHNLVLNCHIDCFPVMDGDEWQRAPYSGEVDAGFVHGRGAVDMKAGAVASIFAFTYMYRFKQYLTGRAILEVVSDEETGGRYGTRYLLERDIRRDIWRGDCVLNAEPGGMGSIRFAEKGTLRLTFSVKTCGDHGAYVHRDEGSIRVAARLIDRLTSIEGLKPTNIESDLCEYLQRRDVKQIADEIMGNGAGARMLQPTVNLGTISGGAKVNMIPSNCAFEADIRLPIGLSAETVLAHVEQMIIDILEASYIVQKAASNPAAASVVNHELV